MGVISELKEHLPYTALAALLGITLMLIWSFFSPAQLAGNSEHMFHVFHPTHILFSAMATTAMFLRRRRAIFKAITVGFFGAIAICGISDIILPFIGGVLLGMHMHFHFCLIEHWWMVIPFAVLGVFIALFWKKSGTKTPHFMHVSISTMATLLYLISFGFDWRAQLFGAFVIVFLGVVIPCCTSDIIIPVLVSKKR